MTFYRQTSEEEGMSHEIETGLDTEYFAVETAFVLVVSNLPANCRIEPNMKFHNHDMSAFPDYENNEF